jgi:hypothetical protein
MKGRGCPIPLLTKKARILPNLAGARVVGRGHSGIAETVISGAARLIWLWTMR